LNLQTPPRDESGTALGPEGWKAISDPASIALVGASGRSSSVSFTPRFLETNAALGYRGDIYLINPNRETILDRKCWRDLSSLPVSPELVIISLPDEKVLPAVHEAIACGARALMIHSGGFGERGEAGLRRERELQRACGEAGVAALGPNCLGLMNLTTGVSLSSFKLSPGLNKGSVALISQSGSVAGILMNVAGRHGVSFVASTGNEAVTTTEDLIEYAIADPATKLIVCFIEALRRPQGSTPSGKRRSREYQNGDGISNGLTTYRTLADQDTCSNRFDQVYGPAAAAVSIKNPAIMGDVGCRETSMSRQIAATIYVATMIAIIVGVDFLFLRDHFSPRLATNVGIVVLFGVVYLVFGRVFELSIRFENRKIAWLLVTF